MTSVPRESTGRGRRPRRDNSTNAERVSRGTESKLTLVSAPAGFGKTKTVLTPDRCSPRARNEGRGADTQIRTEDLLFTK